MTTINALCPLLDFPQKIAVKLDIPILDLILSIIFVFLVGVIIYYDDII